MVIIPRSVNVSNEMYIQESHAMQKCRHLGSTQFLSKSLGGYFTRTQQYEVLCECRDRVRATSRLGRRRRLLRARRDARMTTTTAAARAAWASLAMQFIASTFWAVGAGIAGPSSPSDVLQFLAAIAWCIANVVAVRSMFDDDSSSSKPKGADAIDL